jgi:hypothetical protein
LFERVAINRKPTVKLAANASALDGGAACSRALTPRLRRRIAARVVSSTLFVQKAGAALLDRPYEQSIAARRHGSQEIIVNIVARERLDVALARSQNRTVERDDPRRDIGPDA